MISKYRTILERKKGESGKVSNQLTQAKRDFRKLEREHEHIEKARAVIQEVARLTQEELTYHISDVVSLALAAVFQDPYELVLDFVTRRNKTECDIVFQRDGERVDPLDGSGGGAADVASFALRVALWSLSRPRTRATLILDEPLRFLSSDLQAKGGEMIRQVSKRLGLQIIMVSHVPDLIESADRVFRVSNKKGISEVVAE